MKLAVILALIASPAVAAPVCGPTDQVSAALTSKYGEVASFSGLTKQNNLMTIWINPETGAWTAIISDAAGKSCMASNGEAGSIIEHTPSGDPT